MTILNFTTLSELDHIELHNTVRTWPYWTSQHCQNMNILNFTTLSEHDHIELHNTVKTW